MAALSGTKYPPYLAFSLHTNVKKLISMRNSDSPDVIKCLHGIRVLSTQWIVFGHICLMYALFPIQNKSTLTTVTDLFISKELNSNRTISITLKKLLYVV